MGTVTIQPIHRDSDAYSHTERNGQNVSIAVTGNLTQISVNPGSSDQKLIEAYFYLNPRVPPGSLMVNLKDQDLEIGIYWDMTEDPVALGNMKVAVAPDQQPNLMSADGRPTMTAYIRSYKLNSYPIDGGELTDRTFIEGYALPIYECFPGIVLPGTTAEIFHGFARSLSSIADKRVISDNEVDNVASAASSS